MALHEIGYLFISGIFQCWFWGTQSPCPNAEKIKPAGITRETIGDYQTNEIHYEQTGFAVFKINSDQFEIRKKTGEKIFIHLSKLNQQTQQSLPKTLKPQDIKDSLWQFERLEDIFKNAFISREADFLSLLRNDDLETSITISNEQLQTVRQKRINTLLKESQLSLPIAYIKTHIPCEYKKINEHSTSGSCTSPGKISVYAKPDRLSEKIIEASLSWAHFEGIPIHTDTTNPLEQSEKLLVFDEQNDWIKMKLVILDKSKRVVWLNKNDLPYNLIQLNQIDRVKTLVEFLHPSHVEPSDENRNLAEKLKSLVEQPLELDLDPAGQTKWHNGVLWVKVNVRSEPHCTVENSTTIATGWLPYIDPKTRKKILGWYSRGC